MADRWWLYPNELFWTSSDDSVRVYLVHGNSALLQFRLETRSSEVTFRSDVNVGGAIEPVSTDRLPLSDQLRDELRIAIQRATPPIRLDAIEQDVLDRVAADCFEQGRTSLRRLRLELINRYQMDIATARAKIETLAPRYVSPAGESAYATPLGLLKSEHRGTVQLIVDVTLRAYREAYLADPEMNQLSYANYFGSNRTYPVHRPHIEGRRTADLTRANELDD